MCKICTGYMKCHSTTSNLRATSANILRRRAAASRSELRKMSDCTCVTHIASQLSAILDCSLLGKMCTSYMLIKTLAIIKCATYVTYISHTSQKSQIIRNETLSGLQMKVGSAARQASQPTAGKQSEVHLIARQARL